MALRHRNLLLHRSNRKDGKTKDFKRALEQDGKIKAQADVSAA